METTITTREDMLRYASWVKEHYSGERPIFRILMIEHANKELISQSGKPLGFPDTGAEGDMGFYYGLDDAIRAVEENACDIRETVYDAAFILCQAPGLYNHVSSYARMYFVWNEEEKKYRHSPEPDIYRHIAY